nr:putative HSP20-like chaperone [Tanacetum cinerariifolium]
MVATTSVQLLMTDATFDLLEAYFSSKTLEDACKGIQKEITDNSETRAAINGSTHVTNQANVAQTWEKGCLTHIQRLSNRTLAADLEGEGWEARLIPGPNPIARRHPEIKWAQREDKVYITVVLADTKDAKVNLAPEGVFSFSATAGQYAYDLKLELADKVNVDESKINIDERSIFFILEKAEPKWWNKLLKGDAKTPHYVKVDWDKWVDEDDEAGLAADLDMGGLDFSV